MFSSCQFRWSFTCQINFGSQAWNRAKTTKVKRDVLETPVILMPDFLAMKEVVKFLVTKLKLVFLDKIDRRFATKNPRHLSLSNFKFSSP